MRIVIIGAGRMGGWLAREFSKEHEVAIYDIDQQKYASIPEAKGFESLNEICSFNPKLLINAVSLPNIISAFEEVLPHLGPSCLLADIASVKMGLGEYYKGLGRPFVSTHPMFGPTFSHRGNLADENAIIISESAQEGKVFFRRFYGRLGIHIYECSFDEHDRTIAYSLSIPFASTMVFAACMKRQEAPGTTFKKHLQIAKGLLSEDDNLLSEIMFNPHSLPHIHNIASQLAYLTHIIKAKDYEEMAKFLNRLRQNISWA